MTHKDTGYRREEEVRALLSGKGSVLGTRYRGRKTHEVGKLQQSTFSLVDLEDLLEVCVQDVEELQRNRVNCHPGRISGEGRTP